MSSRKLPIEILLVYMDKIKGKMGTLKGRCDLWTTGKE